jgi:prolyl oligopeptidase
VTGGKLLAQYEHNATSALKLFGLDGKKLADLPLPSIGAVFGASGRYDRDEIFFGFQSFTVPPSIYRVDLTDMKSALWAKVDAPSIDPSAYDVQQVWYTSNDGTKVPMFVVSKKGIEKNGKNPILLTGYGGFNISLTPTFSRSMYLWMEHGGIYAPTCAAAPSSAKTGIAPACWRKNRASLMISSPLVNT